MTTNPTTPKTAASTPQASTKQDILQYLLKQGQATAHELAEALDISPQATRKHLKDLEKSELIEHQSVQGGMGRPQHHYFLSREGKEYFPHRYGEFTVSFLDTLVETVGEEQVGVVLRKQWERKAAEYRQFLGKRPLKERVELLVQLRQDEGYMAELHPVEGNEDDFMFSEHNCAISEVAESFPTVCGHELEMFEAILPDCTVERTHWLNDGEHRCGYLIRAKD
ncbi:MAG: iron-sulfur cluster biosynthesis transcriptional regulator SufR [Kamptonema sp. SIO4C4]|nr:iron-sulfur cluster biosynthesis transcriptional regulator SufR [Kamptonema sp. SIO4C4]